MANPFPKIGDRVTKEKDHPKDCYVFEGQRSDPTIIYMPLFNMQNCKGEEEIKKEMVEYTTFVLSYSVGKMYHLLEKASANMRNNKGKILREIEKAIKR